LFLQKPDIVSVLYILVGKVYLFLFNSKLTKMEAYY